MTDRRPSNLGPSGRRFWRETTQDYEFSPSELAILGQACRILDTIDRLDAALVDAPATVKGSMGQEREHPLLSEVRQQRLALTRVLAALAIPSEDEAGNADQRSASAREIAMKRWAR